MQQPTREHTESIQRIAMIKVTQTRSAGSEGCLKEMWTEQTTPKSKSLAGRCLIGF